MRIRPSVMALMLVLAPLLVAAQDEGCGGGDSSIGSASCASAESAEDALVAPGQSSYTLQASGGGWSGELDFVYTNDTSATISLLNCNGGFAIALQKWQQDAWVHAWSPALNLCLSEPIEIAPGESYAFSLSVFAGKPGGNDYPQLEVDEIDGCYRLVIESAFGDYDHDGPPWGIELPLAQRISSSFTLLGD